MMKRVAVVTGSNKGIGFQVVKLLCSKFDGDVFLCSRDEARGREAVAKLNAERLKPLFFKLDICDGDDVQRLKDKLLDEYGGVDIFINNAGISNAPSMYATSEENVAVQVKIIQTNYFAVANLCDAILPIVKQHGRVINVSGSLGMLRLLKNDEITSVLMKLDLTRNEVDTIAHQYIDDLKNGCEVKNGWPFKCFAYIPSKILLSALTWIQQRKMSPKSVDVFAVHPGHVIRDTGHLTAEGGAAPIIFAALEAKSADDYKCKMIFPDNEGVDWTSYQLAGGMNIHQWLVIVRNWMEAMLIKE